MAMIWSVTTSADTAYIVIIIFKFDFIRDQHLWVVIEPLRSAERGEAFFNDTDI